MQGDGSVINPAGNGTNIARWPRTADRPEREEVMGDKGSSSTACRSPNQLVGLWRKDRVSDNGWNNVDAKPASWSTSVVHGGYGRHSLFFGISALHTLCARSSGGLQTQARTIQRVRWRKAVAVLLPGRP